MGGRGAGSGDLGDGNDAPIKWEKEQDVWTYRHKKTNQEYVDNVNQTLREMGDSYKGLNGSINDFYIAKVEGNPSVMAFWVPDTGELAINKSYANVDRMRKAYEKCVKNGYHPSNGDKTAEQAVIAHETGHTLTSVAQKNMGSKSFEHAAAKIMDDARTTLSGKRKNKLGTVGIAGKISRYATENNAEAIAEAVSDVYCNGKRAKRESMAIVNSLNKYLK